jgi:GT2 family glycosyltransferase
MYPKVSIIILNWNGWEDTIECLESLYQINYPDYDVVLVDNNSDDDSLTQIKEYCNGTLKPKSTYYTYKSDNKPIKLVEYVEDELENLKKVSLDCKNLPSNRKMTIIKNGSNYGFAKGNNIGIKYALNTLKPEYILLLNNDTVVTRNFLLELVKTANHDKIGITGPKILKYHNPEIIDSTGHMLVNGRIIDRGHEKLDTGQYNGMTVVFGAIAACCLYSSSMIREIGLFNESFFMVYEDAELSWRAFIKGFKAVYVPSACIYHKRGSSMNKKSVNSQMVLLNLRNMTRTNNKYGTRSQKFSFSMVILADGIYIIKERLFGRNNVKISKYIILVLKSYLHTIFSLIKTSNVQY